MPNREQTLKRTAVKRGMIVALLLGGLASASLLAADPALANEVNQSSGIGQAAHGSGGPPMLPGLGEIGVRVVAPGDNLYRIARQHGTSVMTLSRLNAISPSTLLVPGRRLWVPMGFAAIPGSGSSSGGAPAGEARSAHLAWPVDPESPGHLLYTVQPGDTLYSIAERFGARSDSLIAVNGLSGDLIAPGESLRVPRPGEGIDGAFGPKRIEVDIGEQRMRVWQGDRLVWNILASTGLNGYPTRRGVFAVQSKVDNAWSSAWQLWMPSWLGIYWAGGSENGIHALPISKETGQTLWGGVLGSPISYGCIVVGTAEAAQLFDWATLGVPVEIHD